MCLTRSKLRAAGLLATLVILLPGLAAAQTRWETASDISTERGTIVGSVIRISPADGTITIVADRDPSNTEIRLRTDSLATRYYGFGTGAEVFTGSAGFRMVENGDRLRVTGTGQPNRTIQAEEILLLGRSVPSGSAESSSPPSSDRNAVEGIVRQTNASENRLMIETDGHEMYTVYGSVSTPVYYKGDIYRIRNIEVGDRIRVAVESRTDSGVRARTIDVLQSAGEAPPPSSSGRTLTSISGRVTRVDDRAQTVLLDTGGGDEIEVSVRFATDFEGRPFRVTDIQVGDYLDVSGQYESAKVFRADTVRFTNAGGTVDESRGRAMGNLYEAVVLYGIVDRPLQGRNILRVRDTYDRVTEVMVVDDFVVRLKNGSYVTADQLKTGDRVVVQAFRGADGIQIAQTIRTR